MRERHLLDFGWHFQLGDTGKLSSELHRSLYAKAGGVGGAPSPEFDDSSWRVVDLPHDWAVELDFDAESQGSQDYVFHGFKPVGRKHPVTSIGWYRRRFEPPKQDKGKRLSLEFDGVYRDSIAWLNGHYLGRHESGYTSFRYDITNVANYGGINVLVVRADATHCEGWWYEGAGIYRHVWLVKTDPLHVAHWGTCVTSEVKNGQAELVIRTRLANETDINTACYVVSTILDADGESVATSTSAPTGIKAWEEMGLVQQLNVENPRLWSIETPHLYRLLTEVKREDTVVDRYETPFGIRTIRFDPEQGFFLNGKHVLIKGVCGHPDHAGLGAAVPDRIHFYRLEKLKEMGSNAVRASHCCPTKEWLDTCDRLGILVIDEHRLFGDSAEILAQLTSMVFRDRNHPSIILWSLGNEEFIQSSEVGARIAQTMSRIVKRLDRTRPTTFGANNGSESSGINSVVDVRGWNYLKVGDIDEYHKRRPDQPIIGTEEASTLSTRGIYANDPERGYVSAYDENPPEWGMTAEGWWKFYAARPFLAGAFVWTGFDYRGEPTPYKWPCISSHFGIMDTCGFPKDNYYYYQSWWTQKMVLHLFPHWNWQGREGEEIDVRCFSNCERVELFLNGKSLGVKKMPRNSHLRWLVRYQSGVLQAKGYKNGKEVAVKRVETTGAPAGLQLSPDRTTITADRQDVAVVNVSVIDVKGRVVPTADNEVTFTSSNARIIGVGNGDPSSHEPDKASKRRAFNGLCQVIVQSTCEAGLITLAATSPELKPATVTLHAVGPVNCADR